MALSELRIVGDGAHNGERLQWMDDIRQIGAFAGNALMGFDGKGDGTPHRPRLPTPHAHATKRCSRYKVHIDE